MSSIHPVPRSIIDAIVSLALLEDCPRGDITATTVLDLAVTARAAVVARQPGVLSGSGVFERVMQQVDQDIQVTAHLADGQRFEVGDELITVSGPASSILTAERVGLNLLQRMSAIATATAELVGKVAHTKARIADTRKTTPGLRALERYAVRCGGGVNHRDNLSEAFMAKDNHLVLLGDGEQLTSALRQVRSRLGHTTAMEVEVDDISQIPAVLAAGVDVIMLDNFAPADIPAALELIDGQAIVEASGNVNAATVAEIAETGVDIISSGAITHSVAAIDLGLDMVIG
ncbi:carboxylating nicotinate-nucleotide diphosphorylase [Glutamicibacter creatinolyticus]|uniref:carboxylating nicotinate-nucleotide diphosphorylase n=1 Tax=Glutamicibacter creatinolyticus TaxID=162496 RepID=UPI0037BFB1CE